MVNLAKKKWKLIKCNKRLLVVDCNEGNDYPLLDMAYSSAMSDKLEELVAEHNTLIDSIVEEI